MSVLPDDDGTRDRRLAEALAERDAALGALAKERAIVNALRAAIARRGEVDPPNYPLDAALEAPPLRYVLADELNRRAQSALGPAHELARGLVARWGRGK